MKKNVQLQDCWIWERKVSDFVEKHIEGYSLNICCGMNELGDVRVDLDPKDKSIIKADMKALPFDDNMFDTVIEDPPWKIGFYDRMKPYFECVRVCKPGGLIIYNAYWIPQSKMTKLEGLWVRTDADWANGSLITKHRKYPGLEVG